MSSSKCHFEGDISKGFLSCAVTFEKKIWNAEVPDESTISPPKISDKNKKWGLYFFWTKIIKKKLKKSGRWKVTTKVRIIESLFFCCHSRVLFFIVVPKKYNPHFCCHFYNPHFLLSPSLKSTWIYFWFWFPALGSCSPPLIRARDCTPEVDLENILITNYENNYYS